MRELGGYLLERPLGAGGVGTVFRGIPRGGGEPVALKIVSAPLCSGQVRESFQREAAVAQAIDHPNVARVLSFGSTEDGGAYLVMELLQGEDLDARLGRGTLEAPEVVRIGIEAAAGLGAAHGAGILHRDVKPSNVFLCADGRVKLVDFGLAAGIQEVAAARLASQPPLVVGTPGYMAVEQARGAHDEDVRTDVWGLGATLYDALVGRPPFDAPTAMAQLVRMVAEEPDPLPAHVPVWLAQVILRALRKDKADRWPTAKALEQALKRGSERARVRERTDPVLAMARRDLRPIALADEVRIVAVVLAERVDDPAVLARAVADEGGVASALLGGRAVGVFGGDEWSGDEAERAVRAALQVRAAAPTCVLGVATGRGVRTRPGEITGAVVARAQAVLSLDGVGADDETLRRIRGGFEVEDGVVHARRAGAPIVFAPGPAGADLPLVGRDLELWELKAALRRAVNTSIPDAVVLEGPAGIGKSRLLRALLGEAASMAERPTLLVGRGEPNRTMQGWRVIAGALRQWAELPEGSAPELIRERLVAGCPSRTTAEFLGELLGADFPENQFLKTARSDPAVMRDQVTISFGDWLETILDERPVILAIDDLHAADRPSVELIEVVLRRLASHRLLFVATARPGGQARPAGARGLELGPLGKTALGTLVQAVLGNADRTARHLDAIEARSAGNPFFAQELALSLLGRDDADGAEPELPASVEAAIHARLDGLARDERDLLRRASVLGRRFWEEALMAMGETTASPMLDRLRRHDLVVRESQSHLGGMTEWRFGHQLLHEVAYASLTPEQRRYLHGSAARWLARRSDAPAAEVARHAELAGETALATQSWQRAAEAAARAGDVPLALEASSRALASRELDRGAAFALRLLRADLLSFRGRKSEEEVEIDELGKLASGPDEEAIVHERWARYLRLRGRYFQASSVLRSGLQLAPGHAGLSIQQALLQADAGHLEAALEAARAALDEAQRTNEPLLVGRALAALAHCHVVQGDIVAAMSLQERALAVHQRAGDPRRIAIAHGNLAYYRLTLGRSAEAVQGLEQAVTLSVGAGNRSAEGYALHNLGLARARAGQIEAGLADEQAALAIAEEIQEPRLRIGCLAYRAAILLEAARAADAISVLEQALATPEDVQGNLSPQLRALYASALVAEGRREEAQRAARQALDLREAAGGMSEFEAELFVAAHEAGLAGALRQGFEALAARAARISDLQARRSFMERVPANVRLLWLARQEAAT